MFANRQCLASLHFRCVQVVTVYREVHKFLPDYFKEAKSIFLHWAPPLLASLSSPQVYVIVTTREVYTEPGTWHHISAQCPMY